MPSRFIVESGVSRAKPKIAVYNNSTTRQVNSQVDYVKKQINQPKKEVADISGFKIGTMVEHARYGKGVVIALDEEEKTGDIDFEGIGVKTFMLEIAPLTIIK